MIKLIKKKKLSANYCHDQHKYSKKNQKPEFKLKPFEHSYEYPQYFFVDQAKTATSKQPTEFFEPKVSTSEYRRMHKFSSKNYNKAKSSSNEKMRSMQSNPINASTSAAFHNFSNIDMMLNKEVSGLRLDKEIVGNNKYEKMEMDKSKLNEEPQSQTPDMVS
jgi:hypothetical protein